MTRTNELLAFLQRSQDELERSCVVLEGVYLALQNENVLNLIDESDPRIDALTARFARTCDILVRKVWRLIKLIETAEQGSMIDIFNYADKLALFEDSETMVDIRELRNTIAHDYAMEELRSIVLAVQKHTPALLDAAHKSAAYRTH